MLGLDVNDPRACRAWAASSPAVDGVLTIRELVVYSTAVLAQTLGVAGNDPEAVARIRNKDLARQRLRERGFAQPSTALCESIEEAERFIRETGPGPWVVKPRDGLASIGVTRIDGPQELAAAVAKFGTPPPAMGNLSPGRSFLVETFVTARSSPPRASWWAAYRRSWRWYASASTSASRSY